jgi:hypothetical protein
MKYRRIPIFFVGRDVYLETRLILQKLEQLTSDLPRLVADSSPERRIIGRLLVIMATCSSESSR